jgi:hypothetical protein
MMNGKPEPLISRGSAVISWSKSIDVSVPGVLTTSGVACKDNENIEDDGDADPDVKEESIASLGIELAKKRLRCRALVPGWYFEKSLYAPQLLRGFPAVLN